MSFEACDKGCGTHGRYKSKAVRILICAVLLAAVLPVNATEDETFRVALTGKYPPFSFYDENGNLAGFDVDMSHAIAEELDRELEIVTTEWDGILAGLLTQKYDAIIGSMAITEERRKQVSFSDPYYTSGAQVFIHERDTSAVRSIDDLAGQPVGVVLGETFENYLRTKHPEVKVVTYKSTVDIFQDMNSGRLRAFLTDRLVGMYQIKKAQKPFVPAGELLYEERMGIPVVQSANALRTDINSALSALRHKGVLDSLHARWFESQGTESQASLKFSGVARRLLKGFAVTVGVAIISFLIGIFAAIPCGVVLNGPKNIFKSVLRAFTDFVRGTPVLIQLFFIYFGAPQIGLTLSPITSAIITLSINACAYMSEVVRSGLMSVDPGQKRAGKALGLKRLDVFRFIIWPQAFRIAIPPLGNSAVALLKDTALISVISVGEVVREAQSIISITFNPMLYYMAIAALFFVFTYPLMRFTASWERALKQRGYMHD
ncbi:MAG: ABC transporter substrate-binding protein/permease [Chitinispirillaceae bacterium]